MVKRAIIILLGILAVSFIFLKVSLFMHDKNKFIQSDSKNKTNESSQISQSNSNSKDQSNNTSDNSANTVSDKQANNEENNKAKSDNTKSDEPINENSLPTINQIVTQGQKDEYFKTLKSIFNKLIHEDASKFEPYYINGIILVNKTHPLPSTYAPGESKEAREAFNKMAADAKKQGINLTAFSTYRSYDYQVNLFNSYVSKYSAETAETFSARPGFSEHQSGLGFDIGGDNKSLWAEDGFKDTKESKWLSKNATKYGFILRFPEGKEWVTGYMYESWHYRYVGLDIAKEFEGKDNYTLEEYLNSN